MFARKGQTREGNVVAESQCRKQNSRRETETGERREKKRDEGVRWGKESKNDSDMKARLGKSK